MRGGRDSGACSPSASQLLKAGRAMQHLKSSCGVADSRQMVSDKVPAAI